MIPACLRIQQNYCSRFLLFCLLLCCASNLHAVTPVQSQRTQFIHPTALHSVDTCFLTTNNEWIDENLFPVSNSSLHNYDLMFTHFLISGLPVDETVAGDIPILHNLQNEIQLARIETFEEEWITCPGNSSQVCVHDRSQAKFDITFSSQNQPWERPVIRAQSPINLLGLSGRVRADYLYDFKHLSRIGGQVLLSVANRFGIDSEGYAWRQKLDGGGEDNFYTGDFNLVYNLAKNERIKFRSGAGVTGIQLDDGTDPEYGYNVTHAADVYLLFRLFLTGEVDWGKINDNKMFHYRVSIGYYFTPLEIFVGYDSYKLNGLDTFDGFIAGGNLWF